MLSHPSFAEAFRFWLKLGFISFGGPAGQIAIMHAELVEKRRWISESRFLHALNYCMLLPGPEAQQLATYVGWLLHRTWGGVVAGALFVLPAAVLLWLLSFIYVSYGSVPWISAIFSGLKPAVLAIVAAAVLRIGKRSLKNWPLWLIAATAFISIYFLEAPFPLIILVAGLVGLIGARIAPDKFIVASGHADTKSDGATIDDHDAPPDHARPSLARLVLTVLVCTALWWIPVLVAGAALGWGHTLTQQGLFFSKAAMVTFGGAYAVLPYVAQQAVERYDWLSPPQMLDGLALAETTPGPLIIVLQFVGYLGAHASAAPLAPLTAATLGALLTTWVTFLPSFLWILAGAPYVEHLRGNRVLSAALSAITAAVVGVVTNLAAWLAFNLLAPAAGVFNAAETVIALAAFLLIVRWKWDLSAVIGCSAALGLFRHFLLPALIP